MGVRALDHVTIRCAQLQRTRDFYVEIMGLSDGARPNFAFRGHWLYLGGAPVVHLVEAADRAGSREIVIPDAAPQATKGTGSFDHVAFWGDDADAMKEKLQQAGVTYRERVVRGGARSQLFVSDPEGVLVEINFRND